MPLDLAGPIFVDRSQITDIDGATDLIEVAHGKTFAI
jgi:hypothetical protein